MRASITGVDGQCGILLQTVVLDVAKHSTAEILSLDIIRSVIRFRVVTSDPECVTRVLDLFGDGILGPC